MTVMFWLSPLIRAMATALLVVLASAAAESLGPLWGALVASLPVSAGPVYVFLAIQHDDDFVASSALSSFAANAATGLFLIVYGRRARTAGVGRSLCFAIAAWFAAVLATRQIAWTPATAAMLNLAIYSAGFVLSRKTVQTRTEVASVIKRRWFELPARAAAVALFVSFVVVVSSLVGPEATGIAAVFPISLISVIVIVQPRMGGAAASLLAANALRSMFGFGLMLLVAHLAIPTWGTTTALVMALSLSVFWSGGLLVLGRRMCLGQDRSISTAADQPVRL